MSESAAGRFSRGICFARARRGASDRKRGAYSCARINAEFEPFFVHIICNGFHSVRDDYHIHVVLGGRGVLETGGKKYELCRGDIFAVVPNVESYYYAAQDDPWHYTWISFGGSRAGEFMQKAGITAENPVRKALFEPETFLAITQKILDSHTLSTENELLRTALLYEAISLFVSSNKRDGKAKKAEYPPDLYVKTAQEYIRRNFQSVTVAALSEYIGITRSYLSHIFQKKLRTSPQAYIVRTRLEQGRKMLAETTLSVQQIAEKIGYENPPAFSKMFHSVYGESPSHYRNVLPADCQPSN